MGRIRLFAALALVVAFCGPATGAEPVKASPAAPAVHALFDEYWEWVMREHPGYATFLGDHRYDDRLKDESAIASYPYADTYRAWPGPNSNTFLAHLGRQIPELRLTLPSTAIGKDYLPAGQFFARTPSGTGYQASVAGLVGVIAGGDEGFELNVLGLVTGFDFVHPALKVPGIGRVPDGG